MGVPESLMQKIFEASEEWVVSEDPGIVLPKQKSWTGLSLCKRVHDLYELDMGHEIMHET
jgi:hypothetical protein